MPEGHAVRRLLRRAFPRDPVVLMHHGFCERRRSDDPENLCVEGRRLERQLAWLLDHGWRPLDLDDYLRWRGSGERPSSRSFLLTIDDGFDSVRTLGVPVLERLGVPAVVYVPGELVGATARWLQLPADEPIVDRRQLRELAERPGIEIGLHGGDHRDLRGLGDVELKAQVARARDLLEAELGGPVRSFAYPYGSHDTAARDAVRDAGFDHAFSVFDDAGPFAVSRIDVNATDTRGSFRFKVGLPHYRFWWRLLSRARFVRRAVRGTLTRATGRLR